RAVLLGLSGEEAATIDPATIEPKLAEIRSSGRLSLLGRRWIPFQEAQHLFLNGNQMFPPGSTTQHPNGVRFIARDAAERQLMMRTYFSVGGGFVIEDGEEATPKSATPAVALPYPFVSSAELLRMANEAGQSIWKIMLANECALRPAEEVRSGILRIWGVMLGCIDRGMTTEGILPGGLAVRRRALRLAARLREKDASKEPRDPLAPLDWVTVYAMAVNEENAAGGRVVTAPTNGAAGVIPAVGRYYRDFIPGADEEGMLRYFLTSAAIGVLYKENASISGAEVGCQGEVGVACSMAAGGLAAALGGSNEEVEHAAEVGMEHNLGMTCDPIGGLVQIPCIERNAMGAVKAVQACRIAMNETEGHKVSLDQVIRTMYLTGLDMQSRYKETSLAGLALNIIEC
ncbi:MAG TPA: L-serine ammonia-lyase, partial [Acidobacteriaceae bacterium]